MRSFLLLGAEAGTGKTAMVKTLLAGCGPCAGTRLSCGGLSGLFYRQARLLLVTCGSSYVSLDDLAILLTKLAHSFFDDVTLFFEDERFSTLPVLRFLQDFFPERGIFVVLCKQQPARTHQALFDAWNGPRYHLTNVSITQLRRNRETLAFLLECPCETLFS